MLSSDASCCQCCCSSGNSQGIQQLIFPCIKKTSISRAKSKTAPKSYAVAIQNLCNGSDAPIMSSNSHCQATDERLLAAKFRLGQEESRLRVLLQTRNSRSSFTLSPDYRTFTAEIQACSFETQLQHMTQE